MPRTYVRRVLLQTLYRDMCSASDEHPVAQSDVPPRSTRMVARGDDMRKLCFFPSASYVGWRDGFSLFAMPPGTKHEGWHLAVPANRADRMWKGPTKALRDGYVVRYPLRHYAYPLIRGNESDLIETDDIQRELIDGRFVDWLPSDSAAHWVRVGDGHIIRVKRHGLNSQYRRRSISARVVMRDFWMDQYFDSMPGGGRLFLDDIHATTQCRIVGIIKSEIRDIATDGSQKAIARAGENNEWYKCRCGYFGPAEPTCAYPTRYGLRCPTFSVTCPSCGRRIIPQWFEDMNASIRRFVEDSSRSGLDPFSAKTPHYEVMRKV